MSNTVNIKKKPGRPLKKPGFNPVDIQNDLLKIVAELYELSGEIKAVATEIKMSEIKIRKLLITAGVYKSEMAEEIMQFRNEGKSITEICKMTGLGKSSVNGYLPYTKVPYNAKELSLNAERIRLYRRRNQCIDTLKEELSEEALWETIVAFQDYPFFTMKGLPFSYRIKTGRDGNLNKELLINRRKDSKSVVWSSVRLAFIKALELREETVARPKQLGDIRGISYIYAMFLRFGIIRCG